MNLQHWNVMGSGAAALAAAGHLLMCAQAAVAAEGASPPIRFAPHRAVYEVSLASSAPGSGTSDMNGRLVYELRGSACEGYTQDMRFVTASSASDGSEQVNDMRSTSFEDPFARTMRFNSSQYQDQNTAEVTQGQAGRRGKDGAVLIELSKPARKDLQLPASVYFPIQHSIALLAAAHASKRQFVADVYDGSDKGDKVSATNTMIGKRGTGAGDNLPANVPEAARLREQPYWPIATAYFERDADFDHKDQVPNYEMAAHFYENGVSTHLLMNYGDFTLRGELSELTFLPEEACAPAK